MSRLMEPLSILNELTIMPSRLETMFIDINKVWLQLMLFLGT
jgi:hypothetical protein